MLIMGLRERLQSVTRFFQKAATKGHQLRQEDEGGENQASSSGDQNRQREARRLGGMSAEDRDWEQASQQRNRDRQAQTGAAKTSPDE
jgi:hypothetical protein